MIIIKWNDYSFCEDGSVLNKDGSTKATCLNKKGYEHSAFYYNGKLKSHLIHSLMAYLFIGRKPDGYEVDHIDNNRSNNKPSNLRYVTKSENNQKSYDAGNRDVCGFSNANCRFTKEQINKVQELRALGKTYGEIVRMTGVGKGTVAKVCKGKHFLT